MNSGDLICDSSFTDFVRPRGDLLLKVFDFEGHPIRECDQQDHAGRAYHSCGDLLHSICAEFSADDREHHNGYGK